MDEDAANMEAKLAEKLAKKQEKKEAKEKAKRAAEAEKNILAIEAKKFERELDRQDDKAADAARRLTPAELAANEAAFFQEYQAVMAGREALKKAEEKKEEAARAALMPNPSRDWKCNGCNHVNTVVTGTVTAKKKKKNKKNKKKKAADSDDDTDEEEEPEEEEAPPEPVTRCHYCGVPHTYMPRGKRGLAVMALNALTEAFDALDGDNWTSRKGWLRALRLSDWHGITADDASDWASGAVLKVELMENKLSGTQITGFCKIATLTHLLLDQNDIKGQLPDELGNLVNLKFLSLCGCQLTGTITSEMCRGLTSLRTLALAGNQLTGTFPGNLSTLVELRSLWLQENRLCGELPSMGTLDELRQLDVSSNQFAGDLPWDIAGCRELQRFDASRNFIAGQVPQGFAKLSRLTVLNLSHNRLEGKFPNEVLLPLRHLSELHMGHNEFEGMLGPDLSPLTALMDLTCDHNKLCGPIPYSLSVLTNLMTLELQSNQFTGNVPIGLKKLKQLSKIDISGNPVERFSRAECRIALEKALPHCIRKF